MVKKIIYIFLAFTFLLSGCLSEKKKEPVEFMRIGEAEISQEEFEIYFEETKLSFEEIGGKDIWETDFDGRTAFDVAKERALNTMIAVKISSQKALETGLALDENSKRAAEESAANLLGIYEERGIEITESLEKTMKTVMEDNKLYELLREYTVKDYEISEKEFQDYYDNYFEDTEKMMRKITFWIISCGSEEDADIVYEKALAGEGLKELFKEYDVSGAQSENAGIYQVYQKDIDGEMAQILDAGEGFVTKPKESYDGKWKVIKVAKIEEGSEEEVGEKLRSDYTNAMWQQIFSKELEKWIGETQIEKNDKAWQDIS